MPLDHNPDRSVSRSAMAAELLDAEIERALALAWRDQRDERALHRLITAYMRLAVSWAAKYRRYGASMNDLIQEASLGLMKAADKFDPDRGVRFSTYAVWWIKGVDPGFRDAQLVLGADRVDLGAEIPFLQHAPRASPAGTRGSGRWTYP